MLPSALPACSAPTAVRLCPNWAACSGDTAPWAAATTASDNALTIKDWIRVISDLLGRWSESCLEGESDHAAVLELRRGAREGRRLPRYTVVQAVGARRRTIDGRLASVEGTEVVHVLEVEAVLVTHVGGNPHRVTTGVFITAQLHGRVAIEADVVGQRQVDIDTREYLVPGRGEVDAEDI